MEKDYFDIDDPVVEGDDLEPTPEEVEAVAEATAELSPEPPKPSRSIGGIPEPIIPLELHAKSGTQYPTEDPGDDTTIWSPSPGVVGCHKQGFRKVK